jgi:hypothetical protein
MMREEEGGDREEREGIMREEENEGGREGGDRERKGRE